MTARLLVYTRTNDYRHDSIPDAVAAVRALGDASADAFSGTPPETRSASTLSTACGNSAQCVR
ncbi:hypothetical protein [Streptomyces bobili]|uniref:hypothetical protein n=1 Tax=Streptomyces bobili TaxID=67280 RepID=UPI003F4D2C36